MHSPRTVVRVPQVCRVVQRAMPVVRSFHYLQTPFLPRFTNNGFGFPPTNPDFGLPSFSQDFASVFKLLDDMTSAATALPQPLPSPDIYQPCFEVRDVSGQYELRGELPGIEQQDLSVEFLDAQTLIIRGRTGHQSSSDTTQNKPEAHTADMSATEESTAILDDSDAASTHSIGSYQRPTVEDTIDDDTDVAASSSLGAVTPSSSAAGGIPHTTLTGTLQADYAPPVAPQQSQRSHQELASPSPHHWVSERSVRSFQRTFSFPFRVNHDGVRATLRNGVLNIVVPKASRPAVRRIQIE